MTAFIPLTNCRHTAGYIIGDRQLIRQGNKLKPFLLITCTSPLVQIMYHYKQGNSLSESSTVHTSAVGRCYFLFLCQFSCQEDAEFDSFGEAGFLVMPAKGGDGVDDVVQLTEGLAGQLVVEGLEV